ncbi:MAG: RHS repeat-associated core domain-containing protein, partial [Planctomycetaceae bacterium]|nr:RHS repeat-associated core domain-containing protein [Planctomycetaceae bacterium]
LADAIVELYAFDAYGNAIGFDPSVALTEFLYSGEQFDSKIGQQYLRARYYDPATGRFNRLDPFFGNLSDPQSLHKYLYTHADPVNRIDPTGLYGSGAFKKIIGKLVDTFTKKSSTTKRVGVYAAAYALTKALIGIRATYVLGNAYIKETGADSKYVFINRAIGRRKGGDNLNMISYQTMLERVVDLADMFLGSAANLLSLRPDIVDATPGDEQFYEIKAWESGGTWTYSNPIIFFCFVLNATMDAPYMPGVWSPLGTYSMVDVYGIPYSFPIKAWRAEPGLILWDFANYEDHVMIAAIISAEVFYHVMTKDTVKGAGLVRRSETARGQSAVSTAMLISAIAGFAI